MKVREFPNFGLQKQQARLPFPALIAILRCMTPLLIILLSLFDPGANAIDWAEVHAKTVRGIDHLYNLEVDEATLAFDSVRTMAPGDPRGHFFASMVHFWLYSLTNDKHEKELFLAGSERVIDVCEALLAHNENDAMALFYLGGIRGYRGMAYQLDNSLFSAVREGREGYSKLREALVCKPDLEDAKMGFGLYSYLVGKAPRGIGWITKLLGFDGDIDGGLRLIRAAADRGTYTRGEATMYYAQFCFNEGQRDTAFVYLNRLIDRYPGNTLWLLMRASWELRGGNTDSAFATAQRAVDINSRKKTAYGYEFAYSTLAGIYFARNDFAMAKKNYDLYLSTVKKKEFISNWVYSRYGLSQEIEGDRAGAVETYAKMRKPSDDWSGDQYTYRLTQWRIDHPLTASEIAWIRGGNDAGRKDYASAMKNFGDAERFAGGDQDERARAMDGILGVLLDQDKYEEAVGVAREIVSLKPVREIWIIPRAYYRLGKALGKLGRRDEALAMLEKAEDFDDYDFEKRLKQQIEDERDDIRKKP
jgi:tetratricopeptide (TPR) repeat protein